MIPIEKYADLCAAMGNTAGDESKENAIAAEHGVSADEWKASKTGWTAKMSDPADMGKTALAFMPIYAAAQAKARGGKEPCTLELYSKVHAEMSFKKDAMGNKLNHHLVLAENGTHHQAWIECEAYWSRKVGGTTILGVANTEYVPELAEKFKAQVEKHELRIAGGGK